MSLIAWVDPRVGLVCAAALESYLLARGWKRVPNRRKQVMVFEGQLLDDDGKPLLLVVPSSERFRDFRPDVIRLIGALSELEERPPVEILNNILKESPPPAPPVAQDGVNAPVGTA